MTGLLHDFLRMLAAIRRTEEVPGPIEQTPRVAGFRQASPGTRQRQRRRDEARTRGGRKR